MVDHPTIGLTADLEVVHPKELLPFPSLGQDHTKARGVIRQRVVTMGFLQERYGKRFLEKEKMKMDAWSWEYGHDMEEPADAPGNGYVLNSAASGALNGIPGDNEMEVVKVRELWLDGPRGTCSRYVVSSGNVIIEDRDLSDVETYCPIGFARFMDNGTFHGAGLFDLMFGIVREMERLLKSLFNNIRDIDKYGVLVMPQGTINERAVLRDIGKGLRYMSYSRDALLGDDFKPMVIQPYNAGDVPGKVAQFAKGIVDSLSPVQDLLAEKGRVDSASGLQFLDEQISKAMTNPTSGVQAAFGGMYKSLVQKATKEMLVSDRALPVNKLTLDLAGAVIDPENGTVSFKKNPIPNFSQISFTVKDTSPRSEVVRKQEAMGLLQAKVTDPEALKLFALKEGLDFAMWMEEEKSAYESIIRNTLLLYGDGQQTQQIVVTPHTARPDLQLRVLSAFMSNPIMSLASPAVQDAFKAYRESLISFMGQSLPAMVPNPDDVALVNPGMMQGGQGPGAQPPQGAMNG
jgi:hypothetical protein